MAQSSTTPHIVLAATPLWSHLRALCVFAAKLAAERPAVVTLVIPHWMTAFSKANAEVERCLKDVVVQRGQIRLIGLGEHSMNRNHLEIFSVGYEALKPFWEAVMAESVIQCSATGKRYDSAAKPSLLILDAFLYPWYSTIRTLSPSVPLFVWSSGTAAGMNFLCLPARLGGKRVDPAVEPNPEEPQNIGRVITAAGLPPMYDWEFSPQEVPPVGEQIATMISRALLESDGILSTAAVAYDGKDALSVMPKWSGETNRPTFHLGPLIPFKEGTTEFSQATLDAEVAAAPTGVGEAIQRFLDSALTTKGEHTVIYICFGTHLWPKNTDHLWALLEVLADRNIPFILSHSSPAAQVPDAVKKQYADEKKGLLVPWSPQQTVMVHKAVGWFITHGGAGGTMDALTQGVPMIGWPFLGDQPTNIAYLTHTADVAFEFLEVRTGDFGLRPILASGKTPTGTLDAFREELVHVLDNVTGEVGSRKRVNARRMQVELAMAWAEGGPARETFSDLVQRYGL